MSTDLSRTEDRVDLDDFGEALPHSLPVPFRPARFPQIADQERRAYRRLLRPLRKVRRATFALLKVPDPRRSAHEPRHKAADQLDWDAYTGQQWRRAISEYLTELQGAPDVTHAQAGWWFSEAALPVEWKLGMEMGLDRAVLLTGASEAALQRFDPAVRAWFAEHAFDRLSDNGRSRLAGILTDVDRPGGSIEGIIRTGIEQGTNPMQVARELGSQFDHYEDYEFARLTRTEVAFAQEAGIQQELGAEGWTEIPGLEYPPWHP